MISTTMYDYVHANANNSYCVIPTSDMNGQVFIFIHKILNL